MDWIKQTLLKGVGMAAGSVLGGPVGAVAGSALAGAAGNALAGVNQRAARRWEERMYNEYNSPSALVRQYNEAGINPALMFGGQTPAAPTDTSAAPVQGTFAESLAQMMQLSLLGAQKDNIEADTKQKQASASASESQARLTDINASIAEIEKNFRPELLEQSLEKGRIDIAQGENALKLFGLQARKLALESDNLEVQQEYIMAQKVLALAQASLAGANEEYVSEQAARERFDNAYRDEFGHLPGTPVWNYIGDMMEQSGIRVKEKMSSARESLLNIGRAAVNNAKQNVKNFKSWFDYHVGSSMNLP